MSTYTAQYDDQGRFAGVSDQNGTFTAPGATNAWGLFIAWNNANGNPINVNGTGPLSKKTRSVQTIINGGDGLGYLKVLTNLQQIAVWNDFKNNTRWLTDAGPNANLMQTIGALALDGLAIGTNTKFQGVALYIQDSVNYLVNPSFDVTINVPGLISVGGGTPGSSGSSSSGSHSGSSTHLSGS